MAQHTDVCCRPVDQDLTKEPVSGCLDSEGLKRSTHGPMNQRFKVPMGHSQSTR